MSLTIECDFSLRAHTPNWHLQHVGLVRLCSHLAKWRSHVTTRAHQRRQMPSATWKVNAAAANDFIKYPSGKIVVQICQP